MPLVHPNRTVVDPREELVDALYARAELLGEFEGPCEALATISDLITRFGDEQNPNIRSTVIDAYLLREQIIQECFRRIDDSLPA
jgi:hypothetical protein